MKWYVVSPEYEEVVPILDDGTGPTEYGCDCVEVEANSKREAIIKGLSAMRIDRTCHHPQYADGNPFTGMKAYLKDETAERDGL